MANKYNDKESRNQNDMNPNFTDRIGEQKLQAARLKNCEDEILFLTTISK